MLSEHLTALADDFNRLKDTGVELDPEALAVIAAMFDELAEMAVALEARPPLPGTAPFAIPEGARNVISLRPAP